MGLHCDTVSEVHFEGVEVAADRLVGGAGQGMAIALSALDSGRLGIAAAATGLAQTALDQPPPTPRSASSSGGRSATTRGWPSCSPTWRPP